MIQCVFLLTGSYRACDHNFFIDEDLNKQVLEVDPDMDPVEPFTTRYLPDIRWPNMDPNISYVIVIIDVGFSTLNYLAFDFPKNTKVGNGTSVIIGNYYKLRINY